MFKRYKEIVFGVLLGAAMWIVDAAMHVELGAEVASHGFLAELFAPHPTAVLFRLVYLVLATAFGIVLWRANWREREVRAFEQAVITFQRQLDSTALRILSHARQLQNLNSVRLDETAAQLAEEIGADARTLDELAQKYLRFSELVRAGQTTEAVKIMHELEAWLNAQKSDTAAKL
jgi:MFS superfamily sulfate permease-like transporter